MMQHTLPPAHSHLGIKRNSAVEIGNKTLQSYANESFKTIKPTGFDNITKIDRLSIEKAMVFNKLPLHPRQVHDRPE